MNTSLTATEPACDTLPAASCLCPEATLRQSEDWYRSTFEHAAAGIAHVGLDGRFLAVNERYCRITGRSAQALLATTFQQITHPEDLAFDEAQAAALLQGRIPHYKMEKRYLRPDGSDVWVLLMGSLVRTSDGTPAYFVAVTEDITARKSAELKLAEREALMTLFVDNAPAAIAMFDTRMHYLAASRRFVSDYGLPQETVLVGRSHYEVFPDLPQRWREIHARVLQGEAAGCKADAFVRDSGRTDWVRWSMQPWRNAQGKIGGALLFSEVITAQTEAAHQRDEAQHRLRESETLLSQVLQCAPDPVWTKDLQGRWTLVNPAAAAVLGHPVEALLGRHDRDVLPADFAKTVALEDERILRQGLQLSIEEALPDASRGGEQRVFLSTKAPIHDAQGSIVGLLGMARDITERKAAERELRIAAVTFEADEGLAVTDEHCIMLRVNRALCRLSGYGSQELVGQDSTVLMENCAMPVNCHAIRETLKREGRWQGEVVCRRRDGSTFPAWLSATAVRDTAGSATHHVVALTDISERKRSEAALLRSQRELAQLAQQLMLQEQQTTQRLAQILHDGLGQTLSALRLQAEVLMAGGSMALLPQPLQQHGQVALELIERAVTEVRGALVELRPPLLESQGLVAALDNELQLRRRDASGAGLHLVAAAPLLSRRWPARVEHAFFMVAREALTNALKHAGARRIECRLEGDEDWLRLQVRDDGNGLAQHSNERPGHLGIVGMRERALAIGGHFRLLGQPGGGSRVELEWQAPGLCGGEACEAGQPGETGS